ncbi:unnamed protein product [Lepidochelys kempii]
MMELRGDDHWTAQVALEESPPGVERPAGDCPAECADVAAAGVPACEILEAGGEQDRTVLTTTWCTWCWMTGLKSLCLPQASGQGRWPLHAAARGEGTTRAVQPGSETEERECTMISPLPRRPFH